MMQQPEELNDSLSFELSPCLLTAGIKVTAAAGGEESPPIDLEYSYIVLDNLDGVVSATFTVRKNHWGFLFVILYVANPGTVYLLTMITRLSPCLLWC
jgi:hypothetical protein